MGGGCGVQRGEVGLSRPSRFKKIKTKSRRTLFLLIKMAKSTLELQISKLFSESAEKGPATRAGLGSPRGKVRHTGAHALFETYCCYFFLLQSTIGLVRLDLNSLDLMLEIGDPRSPVLAD